MNDKVKEMLWKGVEDLIFVRHSAQMHEPDVVVEGEGVANEVFDDQALGC